MVKIKGEKKVCNSLDAVYLYIQVTFTSKTLFLKLIEEALIYYNSQMVQLRPTNFLQQILRCSSGDNVLLNK